MASSGIAYPDRFYAAAAYAGFGPGAPSAAAVSRFQNDVALLLYGLHQQATVGPCNVPKPRAWSPVEQSKWTSWHGLGSMPSAEAMRLFVKILEEEDPGWYSRIPEFINPQPVVDIEMHKPKEEPGIVPALTNGTGTSSIPEPKTISENGSSMETQDKVVILEGLSTVSAHEEWTALSVSGQRPKPRYEHGATVLQDKMFVFGGNHNGRYLSDLQVLDLKSLTWSKIDAKLQAGTSDSAKTAQVSPCAGHSLISCGNKFFSVAGHTKDPSDSITVKEFDPHTCTWSIVRTYGKPPVSRGGQSVTLVGTTLVVFGGEDAKRCLLNDLHILDLETMTWDDVDAIGTPPAPRSDHVAACHADRYLLIFGGGSHATCFNDLHVLDLQTMEWSRPKQQGPIPSPRAGHAGATVGENWYIVGGGNNKSGVSETLALNMSTLAWSVVSTVEGRVPLASEGMTLLYSNYSGEDYLISFGGYNGRYNNEVYALKLSVNLDLQSSTQDQATSDSTSRVLEPEVEISQDGKIREIAMDNADSKNRNDEANEQLLAALKAEKEELEATLNREGLQTVQLKEEITEAEARNAELTKELQSVRGQLAAEQSRCFKLEVDVAELRQKLQSLDALEREVELLRRQKAASEQEQAALDAKQKKQAGSGGVWGWLVGTPPDDDDSESS
ncbi:acyl-CoA-binding domain-containing protein 6 [Hordeum vulgare subsp. vulgare]|uniref:ACB domain-containing protein n=1 Tax=Hordeum vulgare subsp. vulgare TaxID=112509 RepID=A0A8I6XV07_HORVV|nr:acyl-CoA-binding domain-containing protein 6 [Hordeum vulgare subsp. vulgare]